MTDLRRNVKCSNCGAESFVQLSSELDLKELLFAGKCARCGATIQVNYNIVGDGHAPTEKESEDSKTETVNLDETLFPPELPSDALRDLMGD